MKALLILCVIFLFVNCKNDSQDPLAWKNPKTMEESVLVIRNDSATMEQMVLKKKLERLVYERAVVIDNKLVLKVEKDYWQKHDISPAYEALLKEHLEETNHFIKQFMKEGRLEDDFNLKESFLRSKEEYFKKE